MPTEYVFAKVREGGRVRRSELENSFRPIRAEGEMVPCVDYYNRLIIAGDLVLCDPPADATTTPPTTETETPAKASRSTKEK